jgi:lysophospholipase L1-like esterase
MIKSKRGINKNKLVQSLWLFILIISGLFLLSLLPEVTIGDFHFRSIDLFSDLHRDPPPDQITLKDSLAPDTNLPVISTPGATVIPIEDFSGDGKNLMHFYKAVRNAGKRQARIAFYGDSFIEGDIISVSFRDTLQKVFGGNGVGFVPLASETAGFRKSIKHTYDHWNTYTLLTADNNIPIGISGYTYVPETNNTVTYMPGKIPPQKNFKKLRLFYQNEGTAAVYYSINEAPGKVQVLDQSDSVKEMTIEATDMNSIQLHIEPEEDIYLFGASVEDNAGVYVDNFSLRRNSGIGLARLSPALLKQFNRYLNYKLIILQYGLNVASETDSTNYQWYASKMIAIINNLKAAFPQTSFLLLSVSDRGINKDGKITTMEAVPKLLKVQRDIARKSGIAFWNLFEAMGGRNSIPSYTEAVPPLAAKDYTHLTHLGGNKIGKKLADALIHELAKYEK